MFEEDDGGDDDDVAGDGATAGAGAGAGVDEGYEAARKALEALLAPIERAGIDVDPDTARQIDTLCAGQLIRLWLPMTFNDFR